MAFINGNSSINTNGLVFYQDAANKQTYIGSGTNSYDISGKNNNGTFVNNTTFSTDNGGTFVFDGTDDYIFCGTNSSIRPSYSTLNSDGFTIIANVKTDDNSNYQGIFCNDGANQSTYFGLEAAYTGGGTPRWAMHAMDGTGTSSSDRSTATATAVINNGQWYHVAFNFGSFNKTSYVIYVNGVAQSMTTTGGGSNLGYSGSSQAAIGTTRTFDWDGSIARVLCYNRTLSASEILQDYNAVKSRFE